MALIFNFPNDSGPIYKETLAGRFPVEPFNTFSNFLFLAIIIYFSYKIHKNWKAQQFLSFSLPILFVGFIGGTVYHATRSDEIWLYMDWVPIVLLCLAASIYFTAKASQNFWQTILLFLVVFFLIFGIRFFPWPQHLNTSIGYVGTALGVLFPIFVYLYQEHWKNAKLVFLSILSFGAAILFRILDHKLGFLTMGSHWLWHSFGALAVFLLMKYIFLDARMLKKEQFSSLKKV